VQYRIQFLDVSAVVIREWSANGWDVADAIKLIVDADWPPQAVAMRLLDAYGREVHSTTRSDFVDLRLDRRDAGGCPPARPSPRRRARHPPELQRERLRGMLVAKRGIRAGRTHGPAEAVTSRTNRRTEQMVNNDALVRQLYESFNRRDIPAVLTLLAENVDWANGMDGGHVHGREAVRAYWTKQWAAIAPRVDPTHVTQRDDGATAVEVHQVVRDLEGKVLLDETVRHVFQIDKRLVTRFDIENAGGLSAIAHD
jgi:ketosteroid isomerase-like protein